MSSNVSYQPLTLPKAAAAIAGGTGKGEQKGKGRGRGGGGGGGQRTRNLDKFECLGVVGQERDAGSVRRSICRCRLDSPEAAPGSVCVQNHPLEALAC